MVGKKMVLESTTRAIATEAWSQLVHSIISNSPPSDMSRNYYYTYPESGFNYLKKQLKRLERYKYMLGTKNIQTRMRYDMLFLPAYENENQQGIEHIRHCTRSRKHIEVLQVNEDENQQGIEHIRYSLISSKHSEVVQTNEDENHQGIEHIRECLRSSTHSEVVRAYEDENQQGIEHITNSPRSVLHSEEGQAFEVVQTNEDEYPQGIEHIRDCLRSSKHSEVVRANEHENQRGMDYILDSPILSKHSEVVQEDDCSRISKHSDVVQTNKNEYQQDIEHSQDSSRFDTHSELERANEHGNHIKHIRESIKSTVSFKPAEYDDRELINYTRQTATSTELLEMWQEPEDVNQQWINYKEARKLSTLFDELLELIENGDLLGEEKPTLRFQVLKVIKLLHHYGVDTIRGGVAKELEDFNQKADDIEKDMAMYFKKKGLDAMLRICDTESCQRTIYRIIGKAERHQVFFN